MSTDQSSNSSRGVADLAHALAGALQRLLHPGARVNLFVLVAESPGGEPEIVSAPTRERLELVPTAAAPVAPEREAGTGAPERRPDESPVSYLQRVRRERGDVAFKPREWARRVGLSVSEIERAIAQRAVASTRKPDGRDHGARLVSAGELLAYLATVDAVERRTIAPPVWWAAVRMKKVA